MLAVLLPPRVDSSAGEDQVELADLGGGRLARIAGITPIVVAGLRCNAGLRFLSGFLVMFMAFLLRDHPFPGWEDRTTLLLALVVGAAGLGNTIGTGLAAVLRTRRPEITVVVVLLADATIVVLAALLYSLPIAIALGLTVGICQALGKLSLDALIQRDVPENVRDQRLRAGGDADAAVVGGRRIPGDRPAALPRAGEPRRCRGAAAGVDDLRHPRDAARCGSASVGTTSEV